MCLRETPLAEYITELEAMKRILGFVSLNFYYDFHFKTLSFCPNCAKKPITVEQLKHIDIRGWY